MGIKEDIALQVSQRATLGGGSVAVYGGLTATEWAAFGGLACAVIGLIYQIWRSERNAKIMKNKK